MDILFIVFGLIFIKKLKFDMMRRLLGIEKSCRFSIVGIPFFINS